MTDCSSVLNEGRFCVFLAAATEIHKSQSRLGLEFV